MRRESKRCCRLFLFPGAFQSFVTVDYFSQSGLRPSLEILVRSRATGFNASASLLNFWAPRVLIAIVYPESTAAAIAKTIANISRGREKIEKQITIRGIAMATSEDRKSTALFETLRDTRVQ